MERTRLIAAKPRAQHPIPSNAEQRNNLKDFQKNLPTLTPTAAVEPSANAEAQKLEFGAEVISASYVQLKVSKVVVEDNAQVVWRTRARCPMPR